MATTTRKAYRIENFPVLLPLLEKASEVMGPKLRQEIRRALDEGDDGFSRHFQVRGPASERLRTYTFGELMNSHENEYDGQRMFFDRVEEVLFGRLGMIRRIGGGAPMRLQRDILVGWIVKNSENLEIGPIIAGGRHRFMALQILIKAASPSANINNLSLRCTTRHFSSRDELVKAIFADQEGRTMSRAEKREREATGLDLDSREGLISSLPIIKREDYPTALGGFVRLYAIEHDLEGMSLDQFAAAGVTAYNLLKKQNKDLNQKVAENNGKLIADFGRVTYDTLGDIVPNVLADRNRGPKNSKLAKALAKTIASKLDLTYVA